MLAQPEWRVQAAQGGWKSDLWTADFSCALGLVYLQVSPVLDEAARVRFRTLLHEQGIRPIIEDWIDPAKRIHALDSMGHNWWSVCVTGAAIALFALRRDLPEADALLDRIADSFVEFFGYPGNVLQNKRRSFGAQGDFIESVGYLDYTLHNLVTLFDLYRTELGRDLPGEVPVLGRVCDYYAACIQPLGDHIQRLNFGDMGSGKDTVGSYNHHPTLVWLWLAREYKREDLMHLVRMTHARPSELFEFIYWPENQAGQSFADAPGDMVFESIGTAMLRDGYEPESTLFAIKTGETWNHNHEDVGSFILCAAGREFIIDSGSTEYSNPLYLKYFAAAEAHNVILHGERGPDRELFLQGTKFMGCLPVLLTAPGYKYVLADCCGPWQPAYRRFYRHVLWVDDFILLVDDLYAREPGNWSQLWHYQGEAKIDGDSVQITNEGETLTLQRIFPQERTDEFRTGHLSHLHGNELKYEYRITDIPYLVTHSPDRGLREKFVNLLLLPRHAAKLVKAICGANYEGVQIGDGSGTWTFICNHLADRRTMHQNSELFVGDLRTDAFLVGIHRDPSGRLDRFSLHNGSFLQAQGRTLHSSLLKLDAAVALGDGRRTVRSHATAPTWAWFSADVPPRESTFAMRHGNGMAGVHLPSGGNTAEIRW